MGQGQPLRFHGLRRATVAGRELAVASSRLSRLLGLALLPLARAGDGLVIPRCRSVHTFGMRFPLHVVFVDARMAPLSVRGSVPAHRVVREPGASAVVELPTRRKGTAG
jgi:uncharacterized protein